MSKSGIILILLGVTALLSFNLIGSTLDADGFLHEPFALIPIGFSLIITGIPLLVIGLISGRRKRKN